MKASKDGPRLNLRLLQGAQKDEQSPPLRDQAADPGLQPEQGEGPAQQPAPPIADDSPPPPGGAEAPSQDFAFDPDALEQEPGSGGLSGDSPADLSAEGTAFPEEPDSQSERVKMTAGARSQTTVSEAAAARVSPSIVTSQPDETLSLDKGAPGQEPPDQEPPDQEPPVEESPEVGEQANAGDAGSGIDKASAAGRQRERKELRQLRRQRVEAKAEAKAEAAAQSESQAKIGATARPNLKADPDLKANKEGAQSGKPANRGKKKARGVGAATFPTVRKKGKSSTNNRKGEGSKPQRGSVTPVTEPEPQADATPESAEVATASGLSRGIGLVVGFFKSLLVLALIVGPMLLAGYYYFFVAAERYEVKTVFLIRTAGSETPTVTSILGQPQAFGRAADESFSVVNYVTSYEGLARLEDLVDLRAAYSKPQDDPFYYLPVDSSLLELHDYYLRMVDAYYDQVTGLVTIDVRAFTPDDTVAIAKALLAESERLINEFNTRAQEDLLQLARKEVSEALANLESIEQQLTAFRQTNNVIDPMEVITRVNGIIAALEGEIAKAEAELLQLSKVTGNKGGVVRLELEARIEALRLQVERERQRLVGEQESLGTLIPEFELLALRKELAGQAYSASLASMQNSVAQAQRQQLYVVPVVAPTTLDQAQLPDRWESLFFVFLVVLLVFTVGRLLILGIRDHIL